MVFYALFVGAELDGLTNLQPRGGCDDPSYPYYFKLRCENCGETSAKATCVSLGEVVDLPTGRGTANLVQKCKLCGRDGSIVMIPGHGTPLTIEQSQKGEKTCLMVFDCRGYEPVDFAFADGWKAESASPWRPGGAEQTPRSLASPWPSPTLPAAGPTYSISLLRSLPRPLPPSRGPPPLPGRPCRRIWTDPASLDPDPAWTKPVAAGRERGRGARAGRGSPVVAAGGRWGGEPVAAARGR